MSMEKTMRMYQAVTELSEETLWEALEYQFPKKSVRWKSWGAAVACLCMAAVGVLFFGLNWAENSPAVSLPTETGEEIEREDSSSGEIHSSQGLLPEDDTLQRSFANKRDRLESDQILPIMQEYPNMTCEAVYTVGKEIQSVEIAWFRQGSDLTDYRSITVYVGKELFLENGEVGIEQGEKENPPKSATVTEREGVEITTIGGEMQNKMIIFQYEGLWYQIGGTANDSFETLWEVLEWFWTHPIDLSYFSIEEGDEFAQASLADYPQAFKGCFPDFEALGYEEIDGMSGTNLMLKNGEPYKFESRYEKAGIMFTWYVDIGNIYDLSSYQVELSKVTADWVMDIISKNSIRTTAFSFEKNGYYIYVSTESRDREAAEDIYRALQMVGMG